MSPRTPDPDRQRRRAREELLADRAVARARRLTRGLRLRLPSTLPVPERGDRR